MDKVFRKPNNINNPIEEDEYEIETRPVRRRDAVQAGLDYWMDEIDLEKARQRKIAVRNRKVCMYEWSFQAFCTKCILIAAITYSV